MIKWNYTPYNGGHVRCLVAFVPEGKTEPSITDGWSDCGRNMYDGFAWAEYPEDIGKDKGAWKSIYLGDDEPKPGLYILCLHKQQRPYARRYQYYDPDKSVFSQGVEVVAWQKVDAPLFYKKSEVTK